MSDFQDDSTADDAGAAGAARDKTLQEALGKLLSYVNEVYENREQFADDLHIQQIIRNAHQQAERAYDVSLGIISHGAVLRQETSPGAAQFDAAHDDNVVSFPQEPRPSPLTRRELEALVLLRDGYTNKLAAIQMNISPRTFECYRAEAKRKLGARNTAELVLKALQLSQQSQGSDV